MSGNAAEPSPPTAADQTPVEETTGQGRERSGPLELERLRKDDGRALILYSSSSVPPSE